MDEPSVKYKLIEGTYQLEKTNYKGYGISAISSNTKIICSYHDISTKKNEVKRLVKLCNDLKLLPIHLEDVIEDFLASL